MAAGAALVTAADGPRRTSRCAACYPYRVNVASARTHDQVLAELRPRLRPALASAAAREGIPYPPAQVVLVGLKSERRLEAWAQAAAGWRLLCSYAVLGASGGPGPKRRQGDLQVPEGVYRLTTFNPNSSYHLSLRVDYPNADDRRAARLEGRTQLGGDIYIHGRDVSIGCLAIGDAAIEELYVLLADVGLSRVRVILMPAAEPVAGADQPAWVHELYRRLRREAEAVRGPRRGSVIP